MKTCHSCDRHLRAAERTCPFCGARARDVGAPAWAVLTLATALTGCGDAPPADTPDDGGSSSSSGTVDPSWVTFGSATADDTAADDSTGDDPTGGGFIYGSPDTPPSIEPCSVFMQDCPTGDKCMPWASDGGPVWDSTRCMPVAEDPAQPGEPCTAEGSATSGLDDCEQGAMCWDVDPETLEGTCVAMCTGSIQDPVCEDPATACTVANQGVIAVCLPTCDPLMPQCAEGEACYPWDDVFVCLEDASDGQGAYGSECESLSTCNSGLVCWDPAAVPGCASNVGCCTELCDLTDPTGDAQCTGAPEGQQCLPFFGPGEVPPEYVDLGLCTVPPP